MSTQQEIHSAGRTIKALRDRAAELNAKLHKREEALRKVAALADGMDLSWSIGKIAIICEDALR